MKSLPRRLRILAFCIAVAAGVGCRGVGDAFDLREGRGADQALAPVSWLGNSFSGGNDIQAVQRTISDVFVQPDGTVYTYTFYKGGGYRMVIYRTGEGGTGERVGRAPTDAAGGGNTLTVGGGFVYVDDTRDGATRIVRLALDGADTGRAFPIPAGLEARGLAATAAEIYVGVVEANDPASGEILVFSTAASTPPPIARRWPCPQVGELALDPQGLLWAVRERLPGGEGRVVAFDPKTMQAAPGKELRLEDPRDVAVAPDGRLWVANAGADNRLHAFRRQETPPAPAGTMGVEKGIFSDVPGALGPGKLIQPNAVGVDGRGTVYVNNGMYGVGARLEAYTPEGTLEWALDADGAVYDIAALDPSRESDAYGKAFRYEMDWAQPSGREWRLRGFTEGALQFDRVAPFETRERDMPLSTTWGVRHLGARTFIIHTHANDESYLAFHRRDPSGATELAPPALAIWKSGGEWPPGRPTAAPSLWRDLDGNGRFSAPEYEAMPDLAIASGDRHFTVDDRGGIWIGTTTRPPQVVRFPVEATASGGLDEHGNPLIRAAARQTFTVPEPFTTWGAAHLAYDDSGGTDTLYIGGVAGEGNDPGLRFGTALARYDFFTDPARRVMRWQVSIGETPLGDPRYMERAGRYIFLLSQSNALVQVRDTADGRVVHTLAPTSEILSDRQTSRVSAARRRNGEYVVFVDEGVYRKVILYRWNPAAPRDVAVSPLPTGARIGWRAPLEDGGNGYHVWRARGGQGGFSRLTRPPLPSDVLTFEDRDAPEVGEVSYRVSAVRKGMEDAFSYEAKRP